MSNRALYFMAGVMTDLALDSLIAGQIGWFFVHAVLATINIWVAST